MDAQPSPRYALLALANLIAGGFLVVATYGFSEATAVVLGFAVSIAVLGFALGMIYPEIRSRRASGRLTLGLCTAILASWTIVATQVFPDPTARWLVFASALGHIGLSLTGLVMHEVRTERVVHHLEVQRGREPAGVH
jgi:4-hydroxybenzoate polyprenyltransferase